MLSIVVFIWIFINPDKFTTSGGVTMMFIPGISALITAMITKDKISSFGWKLSKIKYIGYAYLLPLLVGVIAYGLVWLSGYVEFTPDDVKNYRWARYIGFDMPAPFLAGFAAKAILATLFGCILTFGEELGWTGYLTPKLLKIKSVAATSVIVGLFWSVWHFPAIIGGVYGMGTPLWVSLPSFALAFIGISFIRTVLMAKSKSLWTGVILHASHNIIPMSIFWEMTVQKGYAGYLVSETGIVLAVIYIITGIIFWKIYGKHIPQMI